MNRNLILSVAALIALAVPSAFAQTSSTTTKTANPAPIQDRKTNQQDRISNGMQDGQLTSGESKNLETKEAGINHEEHTMRSEDNGHLTAADRARINNQQNRVSNRIYNDKHNNATDNFKGEVGQRQENQQDRIAQGIKSGQLTAGQSARLERRRQGVNKEVNGMREANGGKLTKGGKALVNHQQNGSSKNIYAKKHNGAKR